MLDLTKSMIRFSWAMSMLGVDQMTRLVGARGGTESSSASLDAMSEAAEERLGGVVKRVHRAGHELTEGMADALDHWREEGRSNPARALSQTMKDTWEAMDRSLTQLGEESSEG